MNLTQYQDKRDTENKDFAIHPSGSHIARLADAFVLPTRTGTDGKPYTPIQAIFITRKKDELGRPIWVWYQTGANLKISQTHGKPKMFLLYEALLRADAGQQEAPVDLRTCGANITVSPSSTRPAAMIQRR
jgi:hypothetical protein